MTMIRLFFGILFAICISSASTAAGFDHSLWNRLLQDHVVATGDNASTQVDYKGMAADKAALDAYLAATAEVTGRSFDQWNKSDQLAFLLNVYNARTVALILTAYPGVASIKDLGGVFSSPWKSADILLFGKKRSLDYIEHRLIRGSGRYNDPRIHFAVNCASIGCPALRREAYEGGRLDYQLEEQTRQFLGDRSRNRLEAGSLKLSSIFKWYRADFERGWRSAATLAEFLALYQDALELSDNDMSGISKGSIIIEHLNYDWRLNGS